MAATAQTANRQGLLQMHQTPRKPQGPRLYHRKSRTGCFRCKSRRVKCDEQRPACGGCSRHMVECVYPPASVAPENSATRRQQRPRAAPRRQSSSRGLRAVAAGNPLISGLPEVPPVATTTTDDKTSEQSIHPYTFLEEAPVGLSLPAHSNLDQFSATAIVPAPDPEGNLDPPESRARRLTELQLLQHYINTQSKLFKRPEPTESESPDGKLHAGTFFLSAEAVEMAWESDSILYGILAHSALCKWTKAAAAVRATSVDDDAVLNDVECVRWRNLQRQYLSMALREQRRAVDTLSSETADLVCMSALTILSHSFALVQTSPTRPRWQPPIEWLQMGQGAGRVFQIAKSHLKLERMARFLSTSPRFDPKEIFVKENMAHLLWLIDRPPPAPPSLATSSPEALGASSSNTGSPVASLPHSAATAISFPSSPLDIWDPEGPDTELLDDETLRVYHRALMYIGWVERAVEAHNSQGEPLFAVCRRLGAFSVWAPEALQDFLAQRRPRALVILAYLFGLWIPFRDVWLIGSAGSDQLRAIRDELPPRWRGKLDGVAQRYGVL